MGTGGSGSNRDFKLSVIFMCLALLALIVCGRLFWLQVVDAQNNLSRNGGSGMTTTTVNAARGTIYDCNGTILATTVDTINIFCHPHVISAEDADTVATFLAENFGGKKSEYMEKITVDKNFSYLYKNADKEFGAKIRELGIEGLDYERSTKRVYPCGGVGSQVIGMLSSDGKAISGLELYYDDILSGEDGEKVVSYSKDGVPIPGMNYVTKEATPGKDIVVSIDVEMQEEMEVALALNVTDTEADTGCAILMDADTGAIVACASNPTFDITDTSTIVEGSTNMNGINFTYEPGSVFKPAIMLAALEAGTTKAGQTYHCPITLKVGEFTISDSHERGVEDMDTTQIIADSSNVGMSLIAKDLTAKNMAKYIKRYGLTEKTGVDYPGEASGKVADYKDWSKAQTYNIAFGQGITTSPIAITRFYGALANEGVANTPHFLLSVPAEGGEREYKSEKIIKSKKSLKKLIPMLEAVTEEGTATDAQIDGYTIAGKTGTAQTIQDGSYVHGVYNISFCGFIPGASKNLVCYVGATNVPGMFQTVSAFRDIMSFAIDRYNITQE